MITASLASSAGAMLAGQAPKKFSLLRLMHQVAVAGTITTLGLIITGFYSPEGTHCVPTLAVDLRSNAFSKVCYDALTFWGRFYADNACGYFGPDEVAPTFVDVEPLPNRPVVLETLLWLNGTYCLYELLMMIIVVMSIQAVRDAVGAGWSSVQDLLSSQDRASMVVEGKEAEASMKRVIRRAAQLKLLMSTLAYSSRDDKRYRFHIDSSQTTPWWFHRALLQPYHQPAARWLWFTLIHVFPTAAFAIAICSQNHDSLFAHHAFNCSFRWDISKAEHYVHGLGPAEFNLTDLACDMLYHCELRRFSMEWIAVSFFIVFTACSSLRIAYFVVMWWGGFRHLFACHTPAAASKRAALTLAHDFPVWRQYFAAFDDESEVLRSIFHALAIINGLATSDLAMRNRARQDKISAVQLQLEVQTALSRATDTATGSVWRRTKRRRHKAPGTPLSNSVPASTPATPLTATDLKEVTTPLLVGKPPDDEDAPDHVTADHMAAFETFFALGQVRLKCCLWIILRMWHSLSLPSEHVPEDEAIAITTKLRNDFDRFSELVDYWPCVLWEDNASNTLVQTRLDALNSGWRIVLRHYQHIAESHELETLLADGWLQYLSHQTQLDYTDGLRWLAKRLEVARTFDARKLRKTYGEILGRQFDQAPVLCSDDMANLLPLCNDSLVSAQLMITPVLRKVSKLLFVQLYGEHGASQPLLVAGYGLDTDDLILLRTSFMSSQPLVPDIRSYLCSIVDLEAMISNRGWDGVKGLAGVQLAWSQCICVNLDQKPSGAEWTALLDRALQLRGYNGYSMLCAIAANCDMHDSRYEAALRRATWVSMLKLLATTTDSASSSLAEAWDLEIIKMLLTFLFSRQEFTAVDRWLLSSKFLKSGFGSPEFHAAVVKLYVQKASELSFVESDENLLHLVLTVKGVPLEPLIREALLSGASGRVNRLSIFGTLALVQACYMFLHATAAAEDLKAVVSILLDAGADPNFTDSHGLNALSVAVNDMTILEAEVGTPQVLPHPELERKKSSRHLRTSRAAVSQDRIQRLRVMLTARNHMQIAEAANSDVVSDSTTTLRGWREELVHNVQDAAESIRIVHEPERDML